MDLVELDLCFGPLSLAHQVFPLLKDRSQLRPSLSLLGGLLLLDRPAPLLPILAPRHRHQQHHQCPAGEEEDLSLRALRVGVEDWGAAADPRASRGRPSSGDRAASAGATRRRDRHRHGRVLQVVERELGVAQTDQVGVAEHRLFDDRLAVDRGSVPRAHVAGCPTLGQLSKQHVPSRDRGVRNGDRVLGGPADHRLAFEQREFISFPRTGDAHQLRRGTAPFRRGLPVTGRSAPGRVSVGHGARL